MKRILLSILSPLAVCAALAVAIAPGRAADVQRIKTGKVPVCDAGGDQVVECNGPLTQVQLDATGSQNPVPGNLRFQWELCGNPRVTIDQATSATPVLTFDMQGSCRESCNVTLIVTNAFGSSLCRVRITVQDTQPPVIQCPPDVQIPDVGPPPTSGTGMATATDNCDPNPTISFSDVMGDNAILRTWTADDGCQTSSCLQTIQLAPPVLTPHLDLFPGSCPNTLDVTAVVTDGDGTNAVRVTIVGNAFDVGQTDVSSIRISRAGDTEGEPVELAPLKTLFVDLSRPFEGDLCECEVGGDDGVMDIAVFFDRDDFITELGLDMEPDGTLVVLELKGNQFDEINFVGQDCVQIVNN